MVTFPAVEPVSLVFTTTNSSADSSQKKPTLADVPRSTTNPASCDGVPDSSVFSAYSESAICKVVVLTRVCVPLTVKLPGIITVVPPAPIVRLLEPIVSKIVLLPTVISKSVTSVSALLVKV